MTSARPSGLTPTILVRVTPADQVRDPYFYVPIAVPEGTTRIEVALSYCQADDAIIDLGLFDCRATRFPTSKGFRGWSGGARDRFFVATDDATPGYIRGPMPAGTWNVILGLYRVPPDGLDVALVVVLDASPRPTAPQPVISSPVRAGAGWYRGDLHCHSFHSDALGSPEILHAAARQAGLDFLAVADHNTISQRRYFDAHSSPDLVFVRAMEVTTAMGHANVYGVDDWIDFRMTSAGDADILDRLVHDQGGLLSVNHDKPPIPWQYELPRIDCMEVWQSTWLAGNWISLARYQQRLAAGLRISAIGGSDFHQPETLQPEGPLVLGRPTTVLLLDQLSEADVLAAMKAGRCYVTESPTGPHLEISLDGSPMGSAVAWRQGARAQARVCHAYGDILSWIDASGEIGSEYIDGDDWNSSLALDGARGFIRAEVIAHASRERLIDELRANPGGRDLLLQLDALHLAQEPIRRAVSSPIFSG